MKSAVIGPSYFNDYDRVKTSRIIGVGPLMGIEPEMRLEHKPEISKTVSGMPLSGVERRICWGLISSSPLYIRIVICHRRIVCGMLREKNVFNA
ncbi:hypothetical protein [Rhizobium ecuadorense]|uniref:hypothetical protein n=1 Tax=Rhizobium ecuadorense TaxID=1671795 RepID=UPI00128EE571|nr:hypothetical protein [Rhizobium ecuadorense]